MERLNTCDLREKEVINLCDGTRLGCPSDFEFSSCDGKICSIVIVRPTGFCGLGRGRELVIPWNKIECLGEDAILVRLSSAELCAIDAKDPKKKKFGW